MSSGIPSSVVLLRNSLLAQVCPAMQFWVRQQAQAIARSGRFGALEDLRLNEAIRAKFSRTSPPGRAELAAVTTILRFLVLDDAQLANLDLQDLLQKQQQALQMLSNVSKTLHDTAMSIIRKIGG
jgi:hypothetical protein